LRERSSGRVFWPEKSKEISYVWPTEDLGLMKEILGLYWPYEHVPITLFKSTNQSRKYLISRC
jgi:hypothetical protein